MAITQAGKNTKDGSGHDAAKTADPGRDAVALHEDADPETGG